MKIKVNYGIFLLFGIFLVSSIAWNPVLAQIPSATGIGIKINTPADSANIPTGDLTIYGTSSDNDMTDCQVFADWNDLKPMQNVTANGPKGNSDYSKWSFTYTSSYHDIVEGPNELTSKIICYDQDQNATSKFYSINITGTSIKEEITNNTVQESSEETANEDTNILPASSNKNNKTYKILPLYSESKEESTKSASTEDANDTEVTSSDTVELQEASTSKEIIDSDSETYATVSSEQHEEIGESKTFDTSELEATETSDEGLTSHSESNTFFTFEPDLVEDEFNNYDENTVRTSPNTDSSFSNYNRDDNSIFGLKYNGLDDVTKNKLEKRIEKLEDRIGDRVQLFDLIG